MQRGIRFIGNGQAPTMKWMDSVMNDYVATGKVKPTELIVSHRITIEDVANCYYKFDEHDKASLRRSATESIEDKSAIQQTVL